MVLQMHDDGGQGNGAGTGEGRVLRVAKPVVPRFTYKRHLKVMVCGDSMTHGEEGDHTWRYRVWEWFQHSAPEIKVRFVGPMVGTVPPQLPEPPQPPRLPDDPEPPDRDMNAGGYAKDVPDSFDRYHMSHTGRQMAQARDMIKDEVKKHKPDLLLVMLGFNDLAWFVGGPVVTLERTKAFIDNAREANPNISFALANVMHCSGGHDNLRKWTSQFNCALPEAIEEWTTSESPIEHVEIERNYGSSPDDSKGTFDGLHPNELGEYQIAKGFTKTLHRAFGLGKDYLKVPKHIPKRPLPVPSHPKAFGVPYGVRFTFDAVYGSRGYDVRQRIKGKESWTESRIGANQFDHSFTSAGQQWEFQVRARGGDDVKGEWTEIVCGTANRETAPAPRNGKIYSIPTGFEATWDELEPCWKVDRYAMLYFNQSKGGFLCAKGVRGNYGKVDDLDPGDRFEVWLQTWTAKGPGQMESQGTLVVGSGVFSRPASEREQEKNAA